MSVDVGLTRPRWRRCVAVTVALVAGLAIGWLRGARLLEAPRSEPVPASTQPAFVSTSGTASARSELDPTTVPASPRPASSAPAGDAECADPAAAMAGGGEGEAATGPARLLPVVARLRDSADPAAQAVSLLLGDPGAWEAEAWRRQREQVARAALQTQDPRLYELALRACSRLRVDLPDPQDSCSLLSRDRLLQLEPDNAAAWLRKLASAMAAGDEAGASDALYHAAVARRYTHWSSEAARIVADAMTAEPPSRRYLVWRSLTAIAQTDAQLLVAPLLAQCGSARLADANRRQLCRAVDDVLLDRSDSVDTTLPGLVVGWQLGRSAEALAPYLERNELLNQARRVQPDSPADCRDAATWSAAMRASLDARTPWTSLRTALERGGWSAGRLQQRVAALDAAALADGPRPGARAAAPRPSHGHVEILGSDF